MISDALMMNCHHVALRSSTHRVTLNFSPPLRPKLPAAFSARLVDIKQHVWGAKTQCVPSSQIKVVKSLRFSSFFSARTQPVPMFAEDSEEDEEAEKEPEWKKRKIWCSSAVLWTNRWQSGPAANQPQIFWISPRTPIGCWSTAVSVKPVSCTDLLVFLCLPACHVCRLRHFHLLGTI